VAGRGQPNSEGRASFPSGLPPVFFHVADRKNSPCCPPGLNDIQKAIQEREEVLGDLGQSLMNALLVCSRRSVPSSSCLQQFELFPQGDAI